MPCRRSLVESAIIYVKQILPTAAFLCPFPMLPHVRLYRWKLACIGGHEVPSFVFCDLVIITFSGQIDSSERSRHVFLFTFSLHAIEHSYDATSTFTHNFHLTLWRSVVGQMGGGEEFITWCLRVFSCPLWLSNILYKNVYIIWNVRTSHLQVKWKERGTNTSTVIE